MLNVATFLKTAVRVRAYLVQVCKNSLGNLSKDCQRFVDAAVLISAPFWSVKLPNFENLLETPFEFGLRITGFAEQRRSQLTEIFIYN